MGKTRSHLQNYAPNNICPPVADSSSREFTGSKMTDLRKLGKNPPPTFQRSSSQPEMRDIQMEEAQRRIAELSESDDDNSTISSKSRSRMKDPGPSPSNMTFAQRRASIAQNIDVSALMGGRPKHMPRHTSPMESSGDAILEESDNDDDDEDIETKKPVESEPVARPSRRRHSDDLKDLPVDVKSASDGQETKTISPAKSEPNDSGPAQRPFSSPKAATGDQMGVSYPPDELDFIRVPPTHADQSIDLDELTVGTEGMTSAQFHDQFLPPPPTAPPTGTAPQALPNLSTPLILWPDDITLDQQLKIYNRQILASEAEMHNLSSKLLGLKNDMQDLVEDLITVLVPIATKMDSRGQEIRMLFEGSTQSDSADHRRAPINRGEWLDHPDRDAPNPEHRDVLVAYKRTGGGKSLPPGGSGSRTYSNPRDRKKKDQPVSRRPQPETPKVESKEAQQLQEEAYKRHKKVLMKVKRRSEGWNNLPPALKKEMNAIRRLSVQAEAVQEHAEKMATLMEPEIEPKPTRKQSVREDQNLYKLLAHNFGHEAFQPLDHGLLEHAQSVYEDMFSPQPQTEAAPEKTKPVGTSQVKGPPAAPRVDESIFTIAEGSEASDDTFSYRPNRVGSMVTQNPDEVDSVLAKLKKLATEDLDEDHEDEDGDYEAYDEDEDHAPPDIMDATLRFAIDAAIGRVAATVGEWNIFHLRPTSAEPLI